jgi:transcriptional regulator with XRE-family HTH domain
MRLSQVQLAELSDLDSDHIGRVERGEKNVTYDSLLKIARALKLKPSWLLDKANQ